MNKKFTSMIKPMLRTLLIASLAFTLVLSNANGALAARSGGRIGGGGFRRPAPAYRQPASRPPSGGYYPGGGFGFPFLLPIFGVGGGFGGLFTILIFLAVANFLVQSFRRARGEESEGTLGYGGGYSSPQYSVASLRVGLLSEARSLQDDLDQIAQRANTSSSEGLATALQETTLALLRHPEYWAYASSETQQARLEGAEEKFNRLLMSERSKLQEETLSNVDHQLKQVTSKSLPGADSPGQLAEGPGEYIVVTILAATQGNLKLPKVNSSEDLRQALNQLGAVSGQQLAGAEILWTPQAKGDTLTSEEVVAAYPELKLI